MYDSVIRMKNEDRKPVNGCLKKGRKYLNIFLIWNYFHQVSTIHIVQYLFYPNSFCSFYCNAQFSEMIILAIVLMDGYVITAMIVMQRKNHFPFPINSCLA